MIEGISSNITGGAAFQEQGTVQGLIQQFVQQAMEQSRAQLVGSTLKSRSLTKEMINERIRAMALSADRAIANAQAKRLLNKLADKFSLISSMQRNLG